MTNGIRQKIKQLPALIQDVLGLEVCNQVNMMLQKKYNLNTDQMNALVAAMNSMFVKEISIDDFIAKIKSLHSDNNFINDVLGMRFLIIDDYFNGAISTKLKALGADIKQYQAEVKRQKQGIADYNNKQNEVDNTDLQINTTDNDVSYNANVSAKEEKQSAEIIFREKIASILRALANNNIVAILHDYDLTLLSLLSQDKELKFANKLSAALLDNKEKLTFKEFNLNKKPVRPTISNWLKDFISQYGATLPDNLTITRYLTSAPNIKVLDEKEKQLVDKLVALYRNITFFPQSMPKDANYWHILPLSKAIQSQTANIKNASQKFNEYKKQKLNLDNTKTQVANVMDQLRQMAEQYEVGSLERNAVEEEMDKINKS